MEKEAIAIIGPGRMGVGIATALLMANQGHKVSLIDTKKRNRELKTEKLKRASKEVQTNLELLQDLEMIEGEAENLIADLETTPELEERLVECSYLFESLPEDLEVKQAFYRSIGPVLNEKAIIATATSTFHLDVLWEACSKPGNIVSAHWLNPAFLIPLVEVGYGSETREWVPEQICTFFEGIGKIPVKMKTSPGFIVPRIQAAAMNEAIRILEEGVATAEEIDTAIKAGFGLRLAVMGLIEFVDLGGVDILYSAGNYLHQKLGAEHFAPPEAVRKKVKNRELGPRTGQGFYPYHDMDTSAIFKEKYRGFAELLRYIAQSPHLGLYGGIKSAQSSDS